MQTSIAAAEYLRMSTEEQRYSLEGQSASIREFARVHGFTIVKTYSDAARSGLTLSARRGLRQLLCDVASGEHEYRAILVYDVSRWGRFQDVDESAHYEFLCKSAGVSLHYCAETFDNDGSLASTLMKVLKRSMAGEFSRELGIRVHARKRAVAGAGFRVGGRTPFGLRRKIVSHENARGLILEAGERKYVKGERVTLVPGPANEVSCIRQIFRRVIEDGMTVREIARDLNVKGITLRGNSWTQELVHYILTNPVYAGFSTWGRSSRRLGSPLEKLPRNLWTLVPHSFFPIIAKNDFDKAQKLLKLEAGRIFWTKARIVKAAEKILNANGKLSFDLFDATPGCPNAGTLRRTGFPRICRAVGYELPKRFHSASIAIRKAYRLHRTLAMSIVERFPSKISILPGPWPRLSLNSGTVVALLACRRCRDCLNAPRWRITPRWRDRELITIVCLLDSANARSASLFLFPNVHFSGRRQFGPDDPWLNSGNRVQNEADLYSAILKMSL
jgi:DNA invertase Pin-like site-specific DNA recombinase